MSKRISERIAANRGTGPIMDLVSAEPIKVFSARDKGCAKEMLEYYSTHQILLVRGDEKSHRTWKDPMEGLREIWRGSKKVAKDALRKSWSVENACGGKPANLTPDALLQHTPPSSSFYVSCIAQTDASLIKAAEKLIPFETPAPPLMFAGAKHSQPVWLFIGYNSGVDSMVGRPEHTDVVSHSGTWHIQLAGCKRWLLRPSDSKEWGGKAPRLEHGDRLCIDCVQGDILFINTRLWMHHTQIPHYVSRFGTLSFSIAKDFYCDSVVPAGGAIADSRKKQRTEEDTVEEFTNIETIFASRSVKKGAIVLRESELPDCSLPRSLKANCEVATVEDEDGNEEFCLLARCNIKAGDCLAVLPSDDDDDEDDEDDNEDDEIGFLPQPKPQTCPAAPSPAPLRRLAFGANKPF